ncbi:MAG: hypothetical protein ACK4GC_15115, partial [Paracoccaceae bacterium]
IHFSLWDGAQNVTSQADWLTDRSAPFVAGFIDHAESLVPLTVLSANSYARLRPHAWVGAFTCVGLRNREAMIRLVPRAPAADGSSPGASLEYRVCDATANIYLALAAIIRAGLAGIAAGSSAPANIQQDPDTLTFAERALWGVRALPTALNEALTPTALADASAWFGPELASAYYACRRHDATLAAAHSFDDLAAKLAQVY